MSKRKNPAAAAEQEEVTNPPTARDIEKAMELWRGIEMSIKYPHGDGLDVLSVARVLAQCRAEGTAPHD